MYYGKCSWSVAVKESCREVICRQPNVEEPVKTQQLYDGAMLEEVIMTSSWIMKEQLVKYVV